MQLALNLMLAWIAHPMAIVQDTRRSLTAGILSIPQSAATQPKRCPTAHVWPGAPSAPHATRQPASAVSEALPWAIQVAACVCTWLEAHPLIASGHTYMYILCGVGSRWIGLASTTCVCRCRHQQLSLNLPIGCPIAACKPHAAHGRPCLLPPSIPQSAQTPPKRCSTAHVWPTAPSAPRATRQPAPAVSQDSAFGSPGCGGGPISLHTAHLSCVGWRAGR